MPADARQVGAAIDRRHGQIELRTLGPAGQRDRIGWNSALPFCPVRAFTWFADRAEPLAIEPRRRRQLLGERAHDRARAVAAHLLADAPDRAAPRRRRSRTETRAAPAPDRADRPTRVAIAIADARNSQARVVRRHRARRPR